MTTKLVSANLGIRLTLEVDGVQKDVEWSGVCPSESFAQPIDLVLALVEFMSVEIGTGIDAYTTSIYPVEIARPAKIKAPKYVSQDEFNRRVKEIVP